MDLSPISSRAWHHVPIKVPDVRNGTCSMVRLLPAEPASETAVRNAEGETLKQHADWVAPNPALVGIAPGYLGNVANMTVEEATKEIEHVSRLIESSSMGSSVVHTAYGDQQTWSLRVYLLWLQQHVHGLEDDASWPM